MLLGVSALLLTFCLDYFLRLQIWRRRTLLLVRRHSLSTRCLGKLAAGFAKVGHTNDVEIAEIFADSFLGLWRWYLRSSLGLDVWLF